MQKAAFLLLIFLMYYFISCFSQEKIIRYYENKSIDVFNDFTNSSIDCIKNKSGITDTDLKDIVSHYLFTNSKIDTRIKMI